jgi:hypothetical protein
MVPLTQLWLPILVSAVFVFVASSIIHMALPYHKSDYKRLKDEDGLMDALRKMGDPPGDYLFPCPVNREQMKDPAFLEKWKKGPVGFMTVIPAGQQSMAKNLIQWFIYCIVVGVFAGYVAGRALQPGAHYLAVFRFAGATAFVGYALALWQNTIWYKRAWTTTFKSTIDGLIYGMLTAGTFGWLWPK